jgi:hypothetical protein
MPDESMSMFQLDRAEFSSQLFSRVAHCKEISLCIPPGWEILPKYGALSRTPFGDFVELDRSRSLYENSPIKCGWRHLASNSVLAISHFAEGPNLSPAETEEEIARSLANSFSTVDIETREPRSVELGLVKGRAPHEILSAKLRCVIEQGEFSARLVTALYRSHAQSGTYGLSAFVPLPAEAPLKLMREISYSFSHFWILPRPYADGTVVRRQARRG